jgi:hypothetical protein
MSYYYYGRREAKLNKEIDLVKEVLKNFKADKPKKTVFGNYRIQNNELLYVAQVTKDRRFERKDVNQFLEWVKANSLTNLKIDRYNPTTITLQEALTRIKDQEDRYTVSIKGVTKEVNIVAKKVKQDDKTLLLGNSSILPLIGRTVAYGNESRNEKETKVQEIMSSDNDFQMIPFTVFSQANLDLNKFRLIEKGISETLPRRIELRDWSKGEYKTTYKVENVHFTGSSLFEVDGKYYLFDVDRREVKYNIFNPFLAQLPKQVSTIKEAYEILKPKQVLEAEKQGLEVLRQGEWFFIPTSKPKIKKLTKLEKMIILGNSASFNEDLIKLLGLNKKELEKQAIELLKEVPKQQNLQVGNSRPNTVSLLVQQGEKVFCSGIVKHTGREHADLKLNNWYLAVPNTSNENFTITGDID